MKEKESKIITWVHQIHFKKFSFYLERSAFGKLKKEKLHAVEVYTQQLCICEALSYKSWGRYGIEMATIIE